ncbi:MAG TPA: hypothetical protein PKJ94_04840 [Ferruginibacter sp.]|nr:hypothetical protein [Ferruginibacter sp.]
MKYIFYPILSLIILAGCSNSKKNYLDRSDSDNALFDAVKALKKKSSDTAAANALPVLYNLSQQRHMRKINSLKESRELSRWDKLIDEYNTLQDMHNAIIDVNAAYEKVTPANYQQTIYDLKQQAAEDYYNEGGSYLSLAGRDNAKKAYNYYKKADKFVANYKDAKEKMDQAYQNAIVNVQVNPVQDNSFFFNSSWGNYGYNYSNEYFQQTLVRELKNSNRYPARFYTDWEARRDNVQPDWVVDLNLRNMNIPYPQSYRYSRNASKQVETGRDTSGKPVYQTVYATVNITRQSFNARGEMEVTINDVTSGKLLSRNSYREEYNWQEEYATYSGDSRALGANDWALINNNRYNEPRKEEVLNELYRKIYPQVKNRIIYAVDW